MKRLVFIILLLALATSPFAKMKVVASSADLAAIAREIGGDLIEVSAIVDGKRNLHFVEVLPSYMLKISNADLYLKVGLGVDQWADQIIDGSRNSKLVLVDCSGNIEALERPTGKLDASMGDVHPQGNPHYWLDPRNGKLIAASILDGLARADAAHYAAYQANHDRFVAALDKKWQEWSDRMSASPHLVAVAYHNTWPYLCHAFGIQVVGFIEPRPGIEPTASHTAELIELMNGRSVRIILLEPYFSRRAPEAIARATDGTIVPLPSSVGGAEGADSYFSLFDTIVSRLTRTTGNN